MPTNYGQIQARRLFFVSEHLFIAISFIFRQVVHDFDAFKSLLALYGAYEIFVAMSLALLSDQKAVGETLLRDMPT